jgi:hypothetical protein
MAELLRMLLGSFSYRELVRLDDFSLMWIPSGFPTIQELSGRKGVYEE